MNASLEAKRWSAPDDIQDFNDWAEEQGWSDGLPLIPPTPERVARMLAATSRAAHDVVGIVPPANDQATVEVIAANAVMAGCRPEFFPVVLAAVDAICDPVFGLYPMLTTTAPAAPALVINGPMARELAVNGAGLAFGHGSRANATIGRTIRLVCLNVGGATPRVVDKKVHGHPGHYTFCFAENEAASPWTPFHTTRGFSAEDSTVTAFAPYMLVNVHDSASQTARDLLRAFIGALAMPGSNNVLVDGGPLIALCPEHADALAKDGFDRDVLARYLYEHARVPISAFSQLNIEQYLIKRRPRWAFGEGADARISCAPGPEAFHVVVVGGEGKHSVVMPGFTQTKPVTRLIVK